jgi:hypothetical protein
MMRESIGRFNRNAHEGTHGTQFPDSRQNRPRHNAQLPRTNSTWELGVGPWELNARSLAEDSQFARPSPCAGCRAATTRVFREPAGPSKTDPQFRGHRGRRRPLRPAASRRSRGVRCAASMALLKVLRCECRGTTRPRFACRPRLPRSPRQKTRSSARGALLAPRAYIEHSVEARRYFA